MSRNVDWENPSYEDLKWALEWERFRDLEMAGYDPEDLRKEFEAEAEAEGTEGEIEAEGNDYASWKLSELRGELKSRDLSSEGNKAELVARLEESDAAAASE